MNKEVDYDPSISNIKLLKNSENDVNISNMNPSRISKPLSTKFNIDTTINNNMSNVDSSRNYGISNFHSSNSLQNSIKCITFPRSPRFNPNEENSPGFYKLPDINNKRGASIGYGKKFAFKDTADSPPPNKYFIKSKFTENVEKGKGCIIHPKLSYKFGNEAVPGPQRYQNLSPRVWEKRDPISFKFRHGFFYEDAIKSLVSANAGLYNIKDKKIGFNNRYENISIGLGIGNKIDPVNKAVANNPGPGEYTLPSIFDKNKKYKVKLN